MEGWFGTAAARRDGCARTWLGPRRSRASRRRGRAPRRRHGEWDVATMSVVASRRRAPWREAPRRARRDGGVGGHRRGQPAAQPSIAASRRRASRRCRDEWGVATVSVVVSRRRASRREALRGGASRLWDGWARPRRRGADGHGRVAALGAGGERRGDVVASGTLRQGAWLRRVGKRRGGNRRCGRVAIEGWVGPAAARPAAQPSIERSRERDGVYAASGEMRRAGGGEALR